jgi:transposase-like protein
MTEYDITVGKALLPELLSGQDGLAKLVEVVLNQILEAQLTERLSADRHERSCNGVAHCVVFQSCLR